MEMYYEKKKLFKRRSLVDKTKWKLYFMALISTLFSPRGLIIISAEGLIHADTHMRAVWRHYCAHTLPQCEWLGTYHKQEGQAVKHGREAGCTDISPRALILLRQTHTLGSFTSPCTTNTHPPSLTHWPQTHRCTLTHDKPHMLFGGSALSYLVF